MVYIGFGIVAASLSFLIYKHGFAMLSRLLVSWKGRNDVRQEVSISSQTSKQVPDRADGVKAEKEAEERAESNDASKLPRMNLKLEEPDSRNGILIPTFTVDDGESGDEKSTSGSAEPLSIDSDLARENVQQKPSMSMPPPPRPSGPLRGSPQASASALMPPPSRTSPNSSTLRPLRPSTPSQPPPSVAASQTSRLPPQTSTGELIPPPSRPTPNIPTMRVLPRNSTPPQAPASALISRPSPKTSTLRPLLPKPSTSPQQSATALMPPPIRLSRPSRTSRPFQNTSNLRPLRPKPPSTPQPPPSAAASLRVPPSQPLAAPSPSSVTASVSTSTLAPSKRPSKKVLLDPGHSPLDWAHLTQHPPTPTYLRGDSVPPELIRIPPSLLRHHNGRKGKNAWGVWQGKVYNLTPYMKFHPGGVDQLMKAAGREKDGERLFLETHPWVSWESMLSECLVGILVGEEDARSSEGGATPVSSLEEMD